MDGATHATPESNWSTDVSGETRMKRAHNTKEAEQHNFNASKSIRMSDDILRF